ncbi:MAG: flagellar biosynthetic protein FliR [Planctomycetota bacterium]
MPYELLAQYLRLPVFLMVAARLAGMFLFQPILGALAIPTRLRLLLVLGLAALTVPFVEPAETTPDTPLGLLLALASETLLGLLIGMVVTVCFVGVQMGGTLVAQNSGLAFGQIADPTTGQNLTVLSAFYLQLSVVVYLVVGGHRILLQACLDTFDTLPLLGEVNLSDLGYRILVEALAVGGVVAIRVAAPAVLTLFLVNLALGFISRTVPQLNIATVGFSLKSLVGFMVMMIALPSAMAAFTDALDMSFDWLRQLVGG